MEDELVDENHGASGGREQPESGRWVKLVAALLMVVVFSTRAFLQYQSVESYGGESDFWIMLAVALIVMIPLLVWSIRPGFVVKRLNTRPELASRFEKTRDRLLATQLLWLEYAMAYNQVRTGERSGVPSEFALESTRIQRSMVYTSNAVTAWYAGALFGVSALAALAAWSFGGPLIAAMALLIAGIGGLVVRGNRSERSKLGREVLHARHLGDGERWSRFLDIAARHLALEQQGASSKRVKPTP